MAYPDRELHLVMDNYAAHKRVEVRNWLADLVGKGSLLVQLSDMSALRVFVADLCWGAMLDHSPS